MFRKSDGKIGFSGQNLLFNDLPGALSSSSGLDPGPLPSNQKDSVYLYQLQHSNPCALTIETLYIARIIDSESNSKNAFQKLQKLKLLTANGEVDTAAINDPKFGKNLTSALAFISQARQKQVVDFLFWWDEESARLRKLMGEKAELQRAAADEHNDSQQVKSLRDRLDAKIGAQPSQRKEDIEQNADLVGTADSVEEGGEAPPAYN